MDPSGQRLSATFELLEPILYELSTRDILLAQRVCKQWQQVIESSHKLQRALFFQPVDVPIIHPVSKQYRPKQLGFMARLVSYGSMTQQVWSAEGKEYPVYWNPLLQPVRANLTEDRWNRANLPWMGIAWNRPEASWKKMLFTQPAIEITLQPDSSACVMGKQPTPEMAELTIDMAKQRAGSVIVRIDQYLDDDRHDVSKFGADSIRGIVELESNAQLEGFQQR